MTLLTAQPGIEHVAQGISRKIKRQYRQHNG
jgi:hypothetical protein